MIQKVIISCFVEGCDYSVEVERGRGDLWEQHIMVRNHVRACHVPPVKTKDGEIIHQHYGWTDKLVLMEPIYEEGVDNDQNGAHQAESQL